MPNKCDEQRFATEFEWRLSLCLDAALTFYKEHRGASAAKSDALPRKPSPNVSALRDFHQRALRGTDSELHIATTMFDGRAGALTRAERSTALTVLARSVCDAMQRTTPVCESETSFFGHFVDALIESRPVWHVEWAEDMRDGIPEMDIPPQPTPVIRGVFFSSSIVAEKMRAFWDLSSRSDRFPIEIFSAPCAPDDGRVFSSYQRARIGKLFSIMTDDAVIKFASYLGKHAVMMLVFARDEATNSTRREMAAVSSHERTSMLRTILDNVTPLSRRAFIGDAFGLAI